MRDWMLLRTRRNGLWCSPRQRHGKGRAAAGYRHEADGCLDNLPDAFDDRQTETQTTHSCGRLIKPLELLEDQGLFALRNTRTAVRDLHHDLSSTPAYTDNDPALSRKFDGVGNQVLQHAPQQPPVGTHPSARADD